MKVHTGSFWTPVPAGAVRVSIALSNPSHLYLVQPGATMNNYYILSLPSLAPDRDLLGDYKKGIIGVEQYTNRYYNNLCNKFMFSNVPNLPMVDQLVAELESFCKRISCDEIQLCCWEPKYMFCHRFLIYDILPVQYRGRRE